MVNKDRIKKDTHVIILWFLAFMVLPGCGNGDEQQITTASADLLANSYQNDFKIGVALNQFQVRGEVPEATPLIKQHFNSITPENLLKWERVHPRPGQYNFGPADAFVEFGEQNDMFIIGHTLVWHSQVPDWVFETENGAETGREELLGRMKAHIDSVAGRYRGRIDGWDVVNEAVLDNGEMRKSKWYRLVGEDYVSKAFQYAKEAAPRAELYYNDYNLWMPEKRKAVINLVTRLQENNIPIDGIGMQAHLKLDTPSIQQMEESIRAFSDLGLKVMITELDIDVLPREEQVDAEAPEEEGEEVPEALNPYTEGLPDSVQQQFNARYVDLFELFQKHSDKIDRVTFWGLNDSQSWLNNFPIRGRTNYPLLFDREYQPKPALQAVIEASGR